MARTLHLDDMVVDRIVRDDKRPGRVKVALKDPSDFITQVSIDESDVIGDVAFGDRVSLSLTLLEIEGE